MKSFLTLVFLLFCITLTAQDKIYTHTATVANSSGNITYIDHPDLNGNPSAGVVFVHNYNPRNVGGTLNNRVSGLWYNSGLSSWAIYNENLSNIVIGSSYNVYIAAPSNVITHISTLANQGSFGASSTVIDNVSFNNSNPGPYAVMSNSYNPNSVYNNQNYGFYYDLSLDRRTIYEEGANPIPVNASFKILITGAGAGVARFDHLASAGTITGNYTVLDHTSLNNNPDATFVFSHYWGVSGVSSEVNLDKTLGVWYTGTRWAIYTEDQSTMPVGIAFDIIIAPGTGRTYVPDNNFEQALIDLGYDTVLDDYVFTANINTVTSLDVSGRNIADLTGIEDFVALQVLDCYNNQLTSLDLSQNLALTGLYCYSNQLASLNITQNTALTNLDCFGNQLVSLDVTQNTALTQLYSYNNLLTSLDVTQNTALTSLRCYTNQLTSLDVTQNIALTDLRCDDNQLTSLDVTQNIALTYIDCSSNQIASLNLTQNTALINLDCSTNQLTSLDVTQNTALTYLGCWNNQITSLDVTQNIALTILRCSFNNLTDLDVTQNIVLTELTCIHNDLTSLDITQNTLLTALVCSSNPLTSLDVSNNIALTRLTCNLAPLTSLNVKNGNNTNFTSFITTNNPSLACIEVDNAAWSTTNWTNIDPTSSFSENCPLTYVPDNNFEQALIDLGYDTILDDYVFTASINTVTSLNVSSLGIADLTGIEDFIALQDLRCSNNNLASLDLSQNTALTFLMCFANPLTGLNLTQNIALETLFCYNNQLTSLDLTQNIALIRLECYNNQLTSLDLTQNVVLEILECDTNQLTSLNITNGNNTNITTFNTTNNPDLACIEVDNATYSTTNWTNIDPASSFSEDCRYDETYVPDDNFEQALIDFGYDTVLDDYVLTTNINTIINLDVSSQNIADLTGIEDFVALQVLICNNNLLTSLDITQNINLWSLICYSNQLTDLDVSQNIFLTEIGCFDNQLTDLDVSQNTVLTALVCQNNQLISLNVKNGNNINIGNVSFNATNNPNLTCIEVDDVAYSNASWTSIDPQSIFATNCSLTYVPDDNFEAYLEANSMGNGIANDDYVYTANINTVTNLNVWGESIADLTGVEDFTALQFLTCGANFLTNLDISQNTALSYLDAEMNQLTSLDLSLNTALTTLNCGSNPLTILDVRNGNNTNITTFNSTITPLLLCIEVDNAAYSTANWTFRDPANSFSENCRFYDTYVPDDNFEQRLINLGYDTVLDDYVLTTNINTITSLDVSSLGIADLTGIEDFVALQVLDCRINLLTNLDVSLNTALFSLSCNNNQLTSLDVSQNTALITLLCFNNQLSSLSVVQNTVLSTLYCYSNQLTSLNVRNGNNTIFVNFNSTNNPSLLCIEVDSATYSTTNWTNIDPTSSFSEDCATFNLTYVPDDNFEAYLEANSMGNGIANDDYVTTTNINTVTFLNISAQNIADLTGIEGFTALEFLLCNNNLLTNIDISQNTALTNLWCNNNLLTSLDVSLNLALTELICGNNSLTSLDVSLNTALTYLDAEMNQITSLDLTQNTGLTYLNCRFNQLTMLNLKNGNNTNVTFFNAMVNPPLACIEVDNATYSTANWTNISTGVSFSENCSLGLDDTQTINIELYPNPAKDEFRIRGLLENSQLEIYSLTGQLVLKQADYNGENVDISNLLSAIYFVKISNSTGNIIKRLIKK